MMSCTRFIVSLFAVLSFSSLYAQIQLPALISDNMILQQNSRVALWGWARPGEKINIKAGWNAKTVQTTTNADGKWMAYLPTTKAGGPYTISFSGSNVLEVKNVLLGEVWLASGQSNMEFFI